MNRCKQLSDVIHKLFIIPMGYWNIGKSLRWHNG